MPVGIERAAKGGRRCRPSCRSAPPRPPPRARTQSRPARGCRAWRRCRRRYDLPSCHAHHAAVPVVRVFAVAHVGYHEQLRYRALHGSAIARGTGPSGSYADVPPRPCFSAIRREAPRRGRGLARHALPPPLRRLVAEIRRASCAPDWGRPRRPRKRAGRPGPTVRASSRVRACAWRACAAGGGVGWRETASRAGLA